MKNRIENKLFLLKAISSSSSEPWDSDAAVCARVVQGDTRAFETLYDRYSRLVYSVALRVVGPREAEDVLQEVFLKLWRRPMVPGGGYKTFAPLFAVMARNRALDLLRKSKRRAEEEIKEQPCTDCVERGALISRVKADMSRLPLRQRQVLDLAFVHGLTHTEIAAVTGYPLGSVKSYIRNAVSRMRTIHSMKRVS